MQGTPGKIAQGVQSLGCHLGFQKSKIDQFDIYRGSQQGMTLDQCIDDLCQLFGFPISRHAFTLGRQARGSQSNCCARRDPIRYTRAAALKRDFAMDGPGHEPLEVRRSRGLAGKAGSGVDCSCRPARQHCQCSAHRTGGQPVRGHELMCVPTFNARPPHGCKTGRLCHRGEPFPQTRCDTLGLPPDPVPLSRRAPEDRREARSCRTPAPSSLSHLTCLIRAAKAIRVAPIWLPALN